MKIFQFAERMVSSSHSKIETNGAATLSGAMKPLVHYRKSDALRQKQIDELQSDVADKIAEVMASFKETPSRVQLHEDKLRKQRLSRRRSITVNKPKRLSKYYTGLFCVLLAIATVLTAIGVMS